MNQLSSMPTVCSVDPGAAAEVTIVVVNYNAGSILTQCARAALSSTLQVRLIVVDNGSCDSSLEYLRDEFGSDRRLEIVENGANLGFAAACNVGLAKNVSPFVLLLNPDCIVAKDTLERVRDAMLARPESALAGCLLLNVDGTEQSGCRRAIPTPWLALMRVLKLSRMFPGDPRFRSFIPHHEPLPDQPVQIEAISGAFMMAKRSALEAVGLLDAGYFMHCEDLDWCMRFRRAGHQIWFVPDAVALHLKGHCSAGTAIRVEWHKHRGMVRFYRRYFSDTYPVGLNLAVIPMVWARFLAKFLILSLGRYRPSSGGSRPADGSVTTPIGRVKVTFGPAIVVVGATCRTANYLLPIFDAHGGRTIAVSRSAQMRSHPIGANVTWIADDFTRMDVPGVVGDATSLVFLAPLELLVERIGALAEAGIRRIVAVGSASLASKSSSSDASERARAAERIVCEHRLAELCAERHIMWTLLRPTLLYGGGNDDFVSPIVRFVRRFRFFPLFGDATGLRQPLHCRDLAKACHAVLNNPDTFGKSYDLSGGETLSYRDMVVRIFQSVDRRPVLFTVPPAAFSLALRVARSFGLYRKFNPAMAERMSIDLCVDHSAAARDFGFRPSAFDPMDALRRPGWYEVDVGSDAGTGPCANHANFRTFRNALVEDAVPLEREPIP